jgi:flagellin
MPLNITTNAAASAAGYHLARNQAAMQRSMTRLASGKRIISPHEDPGSLSVAMKIRASVSRLAGAQNNLQNSISFLEVQDGILSSASKIINRMNELKSLASQDPMKSTQDIASYDNEFRDLQVQIYQMSNQTFNGVSLFANFAVDGTTESKFRDVSTNNTVSVHTSSDGSSGSKISLHKTALLAAITLRSDTKAAAVWSTAVNSANAGSAGVFTFAAEDSSKAMTLEKVSIGIFEQALANVAYLRAQIGGTTSRVTMAADNLSLQKTNIKAALGRIEDVDIVEETANLAKYNMLTQASAAILSQANTSSDIALMLLR